VLICSEKSGLRGGVGGKNQRGNAEKRGRVGTEPEYVWGGDKKGVKTQGGGCAVSTFARGPNRNDSWMTSEEGGGGTLKGNK